MLVESENIARLRRLAGENIATTVKIPPPRGSRDIDECNRLPREGRSESSGIFSVSLDKVFFLPSLPLTPSFHLDSSCRPEANRPETNRPEITGPEPNRPPQPPPPNVRPDANRPEPDHQQARPDRLRNRQNRRMKRRSSSKNCRSHDGKRATSLRGWRVVGKPATQISKRLAFGVSEMSTGARRL